jgi:hypothetical protein
VSFWQSILGFAIAMQFFLAYEERMWRDGERVPEWQYALVMLAAGLMAGAVVLRCFAWMWTAP